MVAPVFFYVNTCCRELRQTTLLLQEDRKRRKKVSDYISENVYDAHAGAGAGNDDFDDDLEGDRDSRKFLGAFSQELQRTTESARMCVKLTFTFAFKPLGKPSRVKLRGAVSLPISRAGAQHKSLVVTFLTIEGSPSFSQVFQQYQSQLHHFELK